MKKTRNATVSRVDEPGMRQLLMPRSPATAVVWGGGGGGDVLREAENDGDVLIPSGRFSMRSSAPTPRTPAQEARTCCWKPSGPTRTDAVPRPAS